MSNNNHNPYINYNPHNTNSNQFHQSTHYTDRLFGVDIGSGEFYQILEKELPPFFSRQTASSILGNLISAKTLSNLDALGQGPNGRIRLGNKVGYERANFLQWLKERLCMN